MMRATGTGCGLIHAVTCNDDHLIGTVLVMPATATPTERRRTEASDRLRKRRDDDRLAVEAPGHGPPPPGSTAREVNAHRLRTTEASPLQATRSDRGTRHCQPEEDHQPLRPPRNRQCGQRASPGCHSVQPHEGLSSAGGLSESQATHGCDLASTHSTWSQDGSTTTSAPGSQPGRQYRATGRPETNSSDSATGSVVEERYSSPR